MALSYNLGYQESISMHPTRRQIFAGKPYSTFCISGNESYVHPPFQLSQANKFQIVMSQFQRLVVGMLVDNGQFQEFTTSSDFYTLVCPSLFWCPISLRSVFVPIQNFPLCWVERSVWSVVPPLFCTKSDSDV